MDNKIINFDSVVKKYDTNDIPKKTKYSPKQPFRMLMTGRSGGGKTNGLFNILLYHLSFDKIIIYSKSLYQPKYKFLLDKLNSIYEKQKEKIEEMVEKERKMVEKRKKRGHKRLEILEDELNNIEPLVESYDDQDKLRDVDEYPDDKNYIIVFDDIMNTKNQNKLVDYFSRGRHKKLSVVYLTQSYFRTPKTIRDNLNVYSFHGRPALSDMALIYRTLAIGMPKEEFYKIWNETIKHKFDFLYIDTFDDKHPFKKNFFEPIKMLSDFDPDKHEKE
jgi:hypothetical protein